MFLHVTNFVYVCIFLVECMTECLSCVYGADAWTVLRRLRGDRWLPLSFESVCGGKKGFPGTKGGPVALIHAALPTPGRQAQRGGREGGSYTGH